MYLNASVTGPVEDLMITDADYGESETQDAIDLHLRLLHLQAVF